MCVQLQREVGEVLEHSCKLSCTCFKHSGVDVFWTHCFVPLKLWYLLSHLSGCDEKRGRGRAMAVELQLTWVQIIVLYYMYQLQIFFWNIWAVRLRYITDLTALKRMCICWTGTNPVTSYILHCLRILSPQPQFTPQSLQILVILISRRIHSYFLHHNPCFPHL